MLAEQRACMPRMLAHHSPLLADRLCARAGTAGRLGAVVPACAGACAQDKHRIPVVVFILSEPADWQAALRLGGVTAIQTDSPAALRKWLLGS